MNGGRVVRGDEGMALLRSIDTGDRITRELVQNAMFHFLRRSETMQDRPVTDFDLLYFLELMRDVFSDHDYLRKVLAGERPGACFDDE